MLDSQNYTFSNLSYLQVKGKFFYFSLFSKRFSAAT